MQQLKTTLYLFIALGLGYVCQTKLMAPALPWVIVTVALLAMIDVSTSFLQQSVLVAVSGLWVLFVMCLAAYVSTSASLAVVFLVALVAIAMVLAQEDDSYYHIMLFLPVIAMASLYLPQRYWYDNAQGIAFGVLITLLVRCIYWPHFLRHMIRATIVRALQQFSLLTKDVFATFLEKEYQESHYKYEKRLHIRKNHCMGLLGKLNRLEKVAMLRLSKKDDAHLLALINQCRFIYDNLMACAALRWRVKDHSTFGLLADELHFTLTKLDDLFVDMAGMFNRKNPLLNTEALSQSIKLIEQNYQQVLQVAEKDPLVFQLFIRSLMDLCREIGTFFEVATTKQVGFIYD